MNPEKRFSGARECQETGSSNNLLTLKTLSENSTSVLLSNMARPSASVDSSESLTFNREQFWISVYELEDQGNYFLKKDERNKSQNQERFENWVTEQTFTEIWTHSKSDSNEWERSETEDQLVTQVRETSTDKYRRFVNSLTFYRRATLDSNRSSKSHPLYSLQTFEWARDSGLPRYLAAFEVLFGNLPANEFGHWLLRGFPPKYAGYNAIVRLCLDNSRLGTPNRFHIYRRIMEFQSRMERAMTINQETWPFTVDPRRWFLLETSELPVAHENASAEAMLRAKFSATETQTVHGKSALIIPEAIILENRSVDSDSYRTPTWLKNPLSGHGSSTCVLLSKFITKSNPTLETREFGEIMLAVEILEIWLTFVNRGFTMIRLGFTTVSVSERFLFKLLLFPHSFTTQFSKAFDIREEAERNPHEPDFRAALAKISRFYRTNDQVKGITELAVKPDDVEFTLASFLVCVVMRDFDPDLELVDIEPKTLRFEKKIRDIGHTSSNDESDGSWSDATSVSSDVLSTARGALERIELLRSRRASRNGADSFDSSGSNKSKPMPDGRGEDSQFPVVKFCIHTSCLVTDNLMKVMICHKHLASANDVWSDSEESINEMLKRQKKNSEETGGLAADSVGTLPLERGRADELLTDEEVEERVESEEMPRLVIKTWSELQRPRCLTTTSPTKVLSVGITQFSFTVQLEGPIVFGITNWICCDDTSCPSFRTKPVYDSQVMAESMVIQTWDGTQVQDHFLALLQWILFHRPDITRFNGPLEITDDAISRLKLAYPSGDFQKATCADRRWNRKLEPAMGSAWVFDRLAYESMIHDNLLFRNSATNPVNVSLGPTERSLLLKKLVKEVQWEAEQREFPGEHGVWKYPRSTNRCGDGPVEGLRKKAAKITLN